MNFIITSAAAVPMAAVAAVSVPDNVDLPIRAEMASIAVADHPDFVTLAGQLVDASNRLAAAGAELLAAEAVMAEWERRNPAPAIRYFKVGTEQEYAVWCKDPSAFDPNADLKAAMAEHAGARRAWRARKERAEAQCRHAAAEAGERAAYNEVQRLTTALAATPACSIGGIAAKARAAWETGSDALHYSASQDVIRLSPEGDAFMAAA